MRFREKFFFMHLYQDLLEIILRWFIKNQKIITNDCIWEIFCSMKLFHLTARFLIQNSYGKELFTEVKVQIHLFAYIARFYNIKDV